MAENQTEGNELPKSDPVGSNGKANPEVKGASSSAEKTPSTGKSSSGGMADKVNPKKAVSSAASSAAKNVAGNAMSERQQENLEKVQDVAQKAAAAKGAATSGLGAAKGGIAALVAIFGNPIGWIAIALVVILILIYSGMQVIGRTDNADGCYGIGNDDSVTDVGEASGDWLENGATISDWLTSTKFDALGGNPFSKEQAAAVIGNMKQESGVDPADTQGGFSSVDASNQEMIDLGEAGGKAIGLLQLDADRRLAFAKYAEEQGKHWSDFSLQLDWIKMELEGTTPTESPTYNRDQVLAQGFDKDGKDVAFYTKAWEEGFTRAGEPQMEKRISAAEEFFSGYSPGSGSGVSNSSSGGSCARAGGSGSVDTSDAVELAISMSYPTSEESKVSGGDSYGKNLAKPEYKDAKAEAEKLGDGTDPLEGLYASCDRFVATVVRLTMDEDIPWGDTSTQQNYLDSSPKWERFEKKSESQPGDIWVTKTGGHIIFYVGDHDGQDTIAHASYLDRVAALGSADYLNESLVDTGGRAYYGYHFVG